MKVLFIVNDPPYGNERVYNALRLAHALLKKEPQYRRPARFALPFAHRTY
jgi:sulfur relay (sulfurtransferase) complex TusBCD TusD component (DsrE family)